MVALPNMLGGTSQRVSVSVVRALVDTAEHKGVPRKALLAAANLDPGSLDMASGYMPRSALYRLFEAVQDISADSSLALHLGAGMQDQALNVVPQLVRYAATLRHALEALFRFSKLVANGAGGCITEQGGLATARYFSEPSEVSLRVHRSLAEIKLAGLYRLVRSYSRGRRVERVAFEYAAPPYRAEYTRVFDGAECFDQPFTGIVFDRSLMNAVSPYQDQELHSAVCALAERRLMRITRCTPYSVRAHEVLLRQRIPQRVPMTDVARALEISVRSLRRRLSEEGKSYRDIANDASKAVATRMISERKTIQETAYAMGFSDANAFHRAFKRWTGTTPSEFRDRNWA